MYTLLRVLPCPLRRLCAAPPPLRDDLLQALPDVRVVRGRGGVAAERVPATHFRADLVSGLLVGLVLLNRERESLS